MNLKELHKQYIRFKIYRDLKKPSNNKSVYNLIKQSGKIKTL